MDLPPVELRPDTCDALVFDEVFREDVYRMETFRPPKVGQYALDLGANVGAWTLRALASGCGLVVAVEPVESNGVQLMRNIEHVVSASAQVELVPAAVVGSRGVDTLHMVEGDPAYPSISYQSSASPTDEGHPVSAVHIDDLLGMHDSWWMMKLDIEGAEHDVINGVSLDLLNRVDYLTMEFHGPGMGQHTAWIGDDWLGALLCKLTEWGSVQTLGAASRGGMLYGWRYQVMAPKMWQE